MQKQNTGEKNKQPASRTTKRSLEKTITLEWGQRRRGRLRGKKRSAGQIARGRKQGARHTDPVFLHPPAPLPPESNKQLWYLVLQARTVTMEKHRFQLLRSILSHKCLYPLSKQKAKRILDQSQILGNHRTNLLQRNLNSNNTFRLIRTNMQIRRLDNPGCVDCDQTSIY